MKKRHDSERFRFQRKIVRWRSDDPALFLDVERLNDRQLGTLSYWHGIPPKRGGHVARPMLLEFRLFGLFDLLSSGKQAFDGVLSDGRLPNLDHDTLRTSA